MWTNRMLLAALGSHPWGWMLLLQGRCTPASLRGKSCSTYTTGKIIPTVCNRETADVVYLHAQNCFTGTLYWNHISGRDLPWCHGGFNFSFCSLSVAPSPCPPPHQSAGVSSMRLYLLSNSPVWDTRGRWVLVTYEAHAIAGEEEMESEGTNTSS